MIERAVDALIEKTQASNGVTLTASPMAESGHVIYPADAPPSLTFTKPLAITLEGDALPKN